MRLIGVVILSLSLALAPLAAEAQQAGKVPSIGFLQASQSENAVAFTREQHPRVREAVVVEQRPEGVLADDAIGRRRLRDMSRRAPGTCQTVWAGRMAQRSTTS